MVVLMYSLFRYHRLLRQWFGRVFLFISGVKVRFVGEFKDAQLIIMNHQSYLDVIFLEAMHPKNLCWVAKKELGDPILYGHALKAPQMILIDREDKTSLVAMLKTAQERLQEGRILAIFPEGTRSQGEEEFLPFKVGGKMLIEKFELTFQPVVVVNTRSVFDLAKLSVGGEATFIALDVMSPPSKQERKNAQSDWYEDLKAQMHNVYLSYYQQNKDTN